MGMHADHGNKEDKGTVEQPPRKRNGVLDFRDCKVGKKHKQITRQCQDGPGATIKVSAQIC